MRITSLFSMYAEQKIISSTEVKEEKNYGEKVYLLK